MPSIPDRLLALENAQALAQQRRVALLTAVHHWLTSDPPAQNPQTYLDLKEHLEERLAEEGP